MERYERGWLEYESLFGGTPEESLAELRARSPQVFDALVENAGGTLARGGLAFADPEIATVAILAAIGRAERQLAVHVPS